MRVTAKLTSKGQVTVPREVRERLGLKQGDDLIFEIDGDTITLVPPEKDNPFDAFTGSLPPLPKEGFDYSANFYRLLSILIFNVQALALYLQGPRDSYPPLAPFEPLLHCYYTGYHRASTASRTNCHPPPEPTKSFWQGRLTQPESRRLAPLLHLPSQGIREIEDDGLGHRHLKTTSPQIAGDLRSSPSSFAPVER